MLIQTFRDLLYHGFTLAFHCWRCQRWSEADLAAIVGAGHARRGYGPCRSGAGGQCAVGPRMGEVPARLSFPELLHYADRMKRFILAVLVLAASLMGPLAYAD